MKLVAYLRVSTGRQADTGLGLDVQQDAISAWAKANGHRIVAWCRDEGVSGANGLETREGLLEAFEAIEDGAEGLVVYNLGRLSRVLHNQEGALHRVWTHGGRAFSVEDGGEILADDPDDPMRTFVRQVMGAVYQLERAMIGKRMREGRAAKGQDGGYAYGAPPFGYRSEEGELVPDRDEQKALKLMKRMRGEGASLREIARALEAEGHLPRQARRPGKRRQKAGGTSGRWHPPVVADILKRTGAYEKGDK